MIQLLRLLQKVASCYLSSEALVEDGLITVGHIRMSLESNRFLIPVNIIQRNQGSIRVSRLVSILKYNTCCRLFRFIKLKQKTGRDRNLPHRRVAFPPVAQAAAQGALSA